MSNWARAIPVRPEVTTIMRDGTAYRETRYGTVQTRPSVPPLVTDALMQECLDRFYGREPAPHFASTEEDELL